MDKEGDSNYGYGKRPLWQWILICVVVGLIIYGLIYYFVLAKKGRYNYSASPVARPAAGSQTTPTAQTQNTVVLTSDGFSPATMTIKAGTTVTWSNQSGSDATVDSNPHPVHTDYSPLNLGSFPSGSTLFLTFDKAGTYGYHNHLGPPQTGSIVIQ